MMRTILVQLGVPGFLSLILLLNNVEIQGSSCTNPIRPTLSPEDYLRNMMEIFGTHDPVEETFKMDKNKIKSLSIYLNNPIKDDFRPVATFASSLNSFYKNLTSAIFAENPGQNVIYSPIGVSTLLMIMAVGAYNNTLSEIIEHLGFSINNNTMSSFTDLADILENPEGVQLEIMNRLFVNNKVKIEPIFENNLHKYFNSKPVMLNFDNSNIASDNINNWCKNKTHNHISGIIKPDDLHDALIILINAIYFEGNWKMPFNIVNTKIIPFYIDNTTTVDVPMMYMDDKFNHGFISEFDTFFIELPYKHNETSLDTFSMYLLVPEKRDGLDMIEKHLHLIDFRYLDFKESNVELFLPRFKIQSTLDLKPILQKMGIRKIFEESIEFQGINNDDISPYVNKITQKAFLEVNEMGSIATAVTSLKFHNRIAPTIIKVDKPFLCAIVIKKLGLPLFYARIVNPTELV